MISDLLFLFKTVCNRFPLPQVAEVPCVIEAGVESMTKTKQAVKLMKAIGAYDDVEKAKESKKVCSEP